MDFIVFGAGKIGKLLIKYCKLQNRNVIAVYDNDAQKWGKMICGVKVHNPVKLEKYDSEIICLIASEFYWDRIKEQLISYGIDENKILVYSEYESLKDQYLREKGYKEVSETKYLLLDKPRYITIQFIWMTFISYFSRIKYRILLELKKPKYNNGEKKFDVTICAIFRDEADYLKEWIEFHILIGVQHFYLYNNFSVDDYMSVLDEYIKNGVVTLIDWPVSKGQMKAYKHCVENYAPECRWIGFFDIDEFCVPNHYDNVYDFLYNFNFKAPIVLLNWKLFGSSGIIDRDINSHPVVEDFVVSWPKYSDIGKFFYNTAYEYSPSKKHGEYMHYMWGSIGNLELPPVNVFNQICLNGFFPMKSGDLPIQLNHYVVKSYSEYRTKKAKRGGGVHGVEMHDEKYFFDHDMKCIDTDYHAYKYLIALKKKCGYVD